MIVVDSVTRNYGAFTAVDDVSFTAQPGRVTGFLGPNGAGKSTTMRIIVGLTRATSGTVTIAGRSYFDLPNAGLEVGVLLDASARRVRAARRAHRPRDPDHCPTAHGTPARARPGDAGAGQPDAARSVSAGA
jgi:ATPase subunit of ABC transporter with duplicated ATPase domains